MKHKMLLLISASLLIGSVSAADANVAFLLSKELKDSPGKESSMLIVEYPQGNTDPIHRHNAHGSFTFEKVRRDAGEGRTTDDTDGVTNLLRRN